MSDCPSPILQPIERWTVNNVIEWMAALNLYRYAEVFKTHDIKGEDLMALDEEKLKVSESLTPCLG